MHATFCMNAGHGLRESYVGMLDRFMAWQKESEKFRAGEITKEEYDQWRYNYPRIEAERFKADIDALRKAKDIDKAQADK